MDTKEKILNKVLANLVVLYMKFHHYHWYVKGPHFFSLHEKFEEMYDETAEMMDEVAERILTIKGKPISTLKDCLAKATIQESTVTGEQEMIQEACNDLETLNHLVYEAIDVVAGDEGTVDMLVGIIKSIEKHLWMLRSFLEH